MGAPVYLIQRAYHDGIVVMDEAHVSNPHDMDSIVTMFVDAEMEGVERVLRLDPQTLVCTDVSSDIASRLYAKQSNAMWDGDVFPDSAADFIDRHFAKNLIRRVA